MDTGEYLLGEWTQPFFECWGGAIELTGGRTARRKPVNNHTILDADDLAELGGDFAHINDPETRDRLTAEAVEAEQDSQIVQYRPPPDFMAEDIAATNRFWQEKARVKRERDRLRQTRTTTKETTDGRNQAH